MGLRLFKILLFVLLSVVCNGQSFNPVVSNHAFVGSSFIFTINTDLGAGDYFKLPTKSTGTYNCMVDWGDLSTSELTSWDDPDTTHYYSVGGIYTVTITGTFTAWYFNNGGDKDKLIGVTSFGEVGINDMDSAFWGCGNATGPLPIFPETVTSSGYNGFRNAGFTSLDLTGLTNIDFASFLNCNFTSDIVIPSSVTILGIQSFYNCTLNNNDLLIYSSENTIPINCFNTMNNVGNIYFYNTSLAEISAFCFNSTSISGAVYIYAPTAPTISTGSFGFTTNPVLHVPFGAVGYDSGLWLTEFSAIVYDL